MTGVAQLIPSVAVVALLLPLLVPGAVAVGIAIGTIWQKNRADKRDAWWKRVQWAVEAATTPGPEYETRRAAGVTALNTLVDEAATEADEKLVLAIADELLEAAPSVPELDFWDSVLKEDDADE
ncbi:hypothetical protein ACFWUU_32145 [Kribbella sp. NPDC058693]|uniref:hypothetical protein n=1 Tax=Kribbella sp. NPDC058693 TaxID=3346602 RepID=UPI00365407E9